MREKPVLIVMLTQDDKTVKDAYEVFDRCKDAKADFWGMKEEPLPFEKMKRLYAYMKQCGKKTALEVVAYTEQEGLAGAKMAAELKCDVLMGTVFSDVINDFCKRQNLKYMPFVGEVTERPSVLQGDVGQMIRQAEAYLEKGVYGFDLLGYRYTGDCAALNREFVSSVKAPVCIAGSVNSYQRLDEVKEASPWAFTIGGAFFEHRFGESIKDQIDAVCRYLEK